MSHTGSVHGLIRPTAASYRSCISSPGQVHTLLICVQVVMSLVCGSLAGIASSTATFPLDLVRRRLQLEGRAGAQHRYALLCPMLMTKPLHRHAWTTHPPLLQWPFSFSWQSWQSIL